MRWMMIVVAGVVSSGASAQGLDVAYVHPAQDGLDPARQFDFWVGEWDIKNRMFQGEDIGWFIWPSQAIIESAAGGDAIVEFWNSLDELHDIVGFSMRWYDEEAEEWVIVLNWPQKSGSFSRMVGKFEDGVGEFYLPGFWEEKRQKGYRYTFSKATPTSLQWDQAVTEDGGETWKTTWIMEWTRRDHVNEPIDRDKHHRVDETRCETEEARVFDDWVGEWKAGQGPKIYSKTQTDISISRILGGCGILVDMESHASSHQVRSIELWTFDSTSGEWESARVFTMVVELGGIFMPDEAKRTILMFGKMRTDINEVRLFYTFGVEEQPESFSIRYELHENMLFQDWSAGATEYAEKFVRAELVNQR